MEQVGCWWLGDQERGQQARTRMRNRFSPPGGTFSGVHGPWLYQEDALLDMHSTTHTTHGPSSSSSSRTSRALCMVDGVFSRRSVTVILLVHSYTHDPPTPFTVNPPINHAARGAQLGSHGCPASSRSNAVCPGLLLLSAAAPTRMEGECACAGPLAVSASKPYVPEHAGRGSSVVTGAWHLYGVRNAFVCGCPGIGLGR